MTTALFSSFTIKNTTFKNRIVMSPMCMYSSHMEDGKVQNFHITHYTSRAVGQVGLIIVEATAVTAQGRISKHDLGIWEDEQIEGLKTIVDRCHEHGAKVGIQLAHAGRKATVDGEILAPSALAFNEKFKMPKEMTVADIEETINAFQAAARRVKQAGFDAIEIHAAHGYLLHEFLSPLTNKRNDEYGSSPENRYRLLKEVIEAVKQEWDGPLFVRISASDYHPEGLTVENYYEYAKEMKKQGVDLIDCSSGGLIPDAKIDVYPGYQVQFADKIKSNIGIYTGAVGLITSSLHAEEILKSGRADLVFLARELLRNPYWPYFAAKQLNAPLEAPKQYDRGWL
ncbi:NADH:flavin oxidoreductase [Schinkia azotoformans MEV2011]|uniref:NADPH dehydrogenase n=1 Tax=Schinkia azotoformans MEV2011 TaxID=1348973 RepID=A0A072NKA4_SCHAZ|nr:NADPH dehydrogenase NamA [Schinkia azotoformans]KEF37368.1 NADH:flavin oxidoreductase [Schinkia azotoformans MEV2011]MEC1694591.1 NADPH dehydrogenase NamA [Schinkia azotoformans]MEC1718353.1 NADPH dehydrogenase NamA [Schinkia azotoformans]MEC1725652.1 NADPH dehydrogenase NamA [Schinkia azotoformans]MEC1742562.1 NADPH dehydrogenase NamA [Schinkia azotoformans]